MDTDPTYYDEHYWHPELPVGKPADLARSVFGFPTVPGLLLASGREFTPAGLRRSDGSKMPWYTAVGNHDGLVQGNFPASFQLDTVATGSAKITALVGGVSQADLRRVATGTAPPASLTAAAPRVVTPDPARTVLDRRGLVEEHFTTSGLPAGHGFTAGNRTDGTAYYAFDAAASVRASCSTRSTPTGCRRARSTARSWPGSAGSWSGRPRRTSPARAAPGSRAPAPTGWSSSSPTTPSAR